MGINMSQNFHTKVLIIGSGPAGYTAAIYAARADLQPILVRGMEPGGQLMVTTDVENYPGFANVIQGPWLMQQMEAQAKHVGTNIINDHIKSGNNYTADTVIIATGAQAKWLDIESEMKFRGFGVSGCATCDGFFFKNKEVAVVGGGNTAVEEALYLTKFANKVTLIHRRGTLRAEKILQDRLIANPKIKIIWNHEIDEVLGTEGPLNVTAVRLKDTQNGATQELKIDGIFIAIGHVPNTSLFVDALEMDNEKYIITFPNSTQTNIKGVFAAGDVQDKVYRQAVTAAGTGCMAALEAERYLSEHK